MPFHVCEKLKKFFGHLSSHASRMQCFAFIFLFPRRHVFLQFLFSFFFLAPLRGYHKWTLRAVHLDLAHVLFENLDKIGLAFQWLYFCNFAYYDQASCKCSICIEFFFLLEAGMLAVRINSFLPCSDVKLSPLGCEEQLS